MNIFHSKGCTFWGKRPWSRKKKLICQIGTLIGAPLGIAVIAGISVPAILLAFPAVVGSKVYRKMNTKYSKEAAVLREIHAMEDAAAVASASSSSTQTPSKTTAPDIKLRDRPRNLDALNEINFYEEGLEIEQYLND